MRELSAHVLVRNGDIDEIRELCELKGELKAKVQDLLPAMSESLSTARLARQGIRW